MLTQEQILAMGNSLEQLPTLTISTKAQLDALPEEHRAEIMRMHKAEFLIEQAARFGISMEPYAQKIMEILSDVHLVAVKRGYHFGTSSEVEAIFNKEMIEDLLNNNLGV